MKIRYYNLITLGRYNMWIYDNNYNNTKLCLIQLFRLVPIYSSLASLGTFFYFLIQEIIVWSYNRDCIIINSTLYLHNIIFNIFNFKGLFIHLWLIHRPCLSSTFWVPLKECPVEVQTFFPNENIPLLLYIVVA